MSLVPVSNKPKFTFNCVEFQIDGVTRREVSYLKNLYNPSKDGELLEEDRTVHYRPPIVNEIP